MKSVRQGQWLGDVVIRESGDIPALVVTAIENDVSITGTIAAGTPLKTVAPESLSAKTVAAYYRNKNIYPATETEREPDTQGGIGYMAVGITFIVS